MSLWMPCFLKLQIPIRIGETTGTPKLEGHDFARLRLELAADLATPTCRIRSSCATTLPSGRARCTSKSRSRPDGIDDAAHRTREAPPCAQLPGLAKCEEYNRFLLQQSLSDPILCRPRNEIVVRIDDEKYSDLFVKLQICYVLSFYAFTNRSLFGDNAPRHCCFSDAIFSGMTNVTTPLSRGWWFASSNSMSTLCGPGRRPIRMIGLPLASAHTHEASSTLT
jgi:hypothetical protein